MHGAPIARRRGCGLRLDRAPPRLSKLLPMTRIERSLRTLFMQALDRMRARGGAAGPEADPGEPEPLRAPLFSSDQMVAHGKQLAAGHRIARHHAPDRLLARLASNERVLERCVLRMREA